MNEITEIVRLIRRLRKAGPVSILDNIIETLTYNVGRFLLSFLTKWPYIWLRVNNVYSCKLFTRLFYIKNWSNIVY